ncbi:MAG: esterase-like activity of phytase family protein [Pseudomonadota bacterium]
MRRLAGLGVVLALAACQAQTPPLPAAPIPVGPFVRVDAEAVPMDTANPANTRLGAFTYAGGVALTSRDTSRLHGFSDLKIFPDGRFIAVGDQADLLEGRIVLGVDGRLTGVADATLIALKDENGQDLYAGGQREYDSEGVARLGNGALVISMEQNDRVLAYARPDGVPRRAPAPDIKYTFNKGMEALAAAPDVAPDAYRVGLEDSGWTFLCRLSAACVRERDLDLEGSELVAMEPLPGGRMAYLLRSYSPLTGNIVRLRIIDREGRKLDGMEIRRPLTVDNLEGLAASVGRNGRIRFYLISDDNFGTYSGLPTDQRTLLLAFDWTPKP